MTTPARASRETELDLLRCVAALAVIGFHFVDRGPRAGVMPALAPDLAAHLFAYGYLGVHLFFVISGYVILMTAERASPVGFVASRVSRLVPAFWVGASLTVLFALVLGFPRYQPDLAGFLLNLTLVPEQFGASMIDGVYWSLAVEIQFYLLVLLALRADLLRHTEALVAAWLALALAELVVVPSWTLQVWLCTRWAPLFCAGILFYRMRAHGASRARLALLTGAAALAGVNAWMEATRPTESARADFEPAVAVVLVLGFFAVFGAIHRGWIRVPANPWIALGAALSYPVYLVHQNIGYMIATRLAERGWGGVALASAIAVAFALAWAVHRGVERPVGRPLRRAIEAALGRAPTRWTGSARRAPGA